MNRRQFLSMAPLVALPLSLPASTQAEQHESWDGVPWPNEEFLDRWRLFYSCVGFLRKGMPTGSYFCAEEEFQQLLLRGASMRCVTIRGWAEDGEDLPYALSRKIDRQLRTGERVSPPRFYIKRGCPKEIQISAYIVEVCS